MSNSYIFRFAIIMVVLVAAILTAVATLLKPMQEANKNAEKMQAILSSANINVERSEAIDKYKEKLLAEYTISLDGEIVYTYKGDKESENNPKRAFNTNMKKLLDELKRHKKGDLDKAPNLPMYVLEGNQGDSLFIIPVRGKGLWGPIWGNIALKKDMNTVVGASFDHDGETPGLGAEINTDEFSDQFKGKKLFNEQNEFESIDVVKGGVENSSVPPKHGVDGISGGTITSNGVSDMIEDVIKNYLPFIKKHK